jgi:caffeoyl-CoA O-methyltransferase
MLSLLPAGLEAYVTAHSAPEPPLLAELRAHTQAQLALPQMQVGPVEGALLRLLAQISGAQRVLELGTYSGYSALCLAQGLPPSGRVVTCDIDPHTTAVAREFWARSPDGGKIELRLGPALTTIAALAAEGAQFDLVFIDADKLNYGHYWDAVVPLVPPGGLILADNTLWSGKVSDPQDDETRAIAAFNRRVHEDPRCDHVLLSVRDGLMLARRLG